MSAALTRQTGTVQGKQEAFVPHAIKVAEAARARCGNNETLDDEQLANTRVAEIKQWKNDVCDLHRVMSVAQGMFLLLEQNNEALLRVAIEIVCDSTATKVLWWNDNWYADEEQRTYFREMVLGMLGKCMAYMNVEAEPLDTEKIDELEDKLKQALERCSMLEASRNALEGSKSMLEMQLKDLEAQLAERMAREKDMQQANEKLKEELKAAQNRGPEVDPNLLSKLADLEARLKTSEEQKMLMEEKLKKAEEQARMAGSEGSATDEEMEAMRKKMEELEKRAKEEAARANAADKKAQDAAKQIAQLKADAAKGGSRPAPTKADGGGEENIHRLEGQVHDLEDALVNEKKHVTDLESELARMKRELAESQAEAKKLKNRPPETIIVEKEVTTPSSTTSKDKEKKRRSQEEEDDEVPVVIERKVRTESDESPSQKKGVSQAAYDAKCAELDKANKQVEKYKKQNEALREENEALESRNDKMLKMLHQLKEQLRKVTEIAEKRGCGDLVKSILEEANVTATLDSPEFTCFDRLYEDAKRRMEKQRVWEEQRMGLRPKDAVARRQFINNNNQWAPGGGQLFHTSAPPEGGAVQGAGYWGQGQGQWGAAQMGSSEQHAYTPYSMYAHGDSQGGSSGAAYAPYSQNMPPGTPGAPYAPYAPYLQNQVSAPALSLDLGSPDARSVRALSRSLPGDAQDWMRADAGFGGLDDSMRVVGFGQKSFEMGLRPDSAFSRISTSTLAPNSTRTGTPLAGSIGRSSPLLTLDGPLGASIGRSSPQLQGSISLGNLNSAPAMSMSLDAHGLQAIRATRSRSDVHSAPAAQSLDAYGPQGSPPNSANHQRRLVGSSSVGRLDADPIKQMLVQSRSATSVGRLDAGRFPPVDLAASSGSASCPLLEWGNPGSSNGGASMGLFTERTNPGPGLFRGFKLLSAKPERGGHRLPPCSPPSRPASSQELATDPHNRNNALLLEPNFSSTLL